MFMPWHFTQLRFVAPTASAPFAAVAASRLVGSGAGAGAAVLELLPHAEALARATTAAPITIKVRCQVIPEASPSETVTPAPSHKNASPGGCQARLSRSRA